MTHTKKFTQNWPKNSFFCQFRTFPVTEGYAIWHSISSSQPQQESSPTEWNSSTQEGTNFRHAMFLRCLEPEKCQKPTQKTARISNTPCFFTTLSLRNAKNYPENSTNFSNAIILCYLEPAKCQKTTKRHEFHTKLHSLTPATMPRKVLVFHNFAHRLKCIHLTSIYTNQNTTTWEHLIAWFLNCRPIVTHSDSSTLAQDTILNCYKKPAHNNYQFSNFSEGQLHLV